MPHRRASRPAWGWLFTGLALIASGFAHANPETTEEALLAAYQRADAMQASKATRMFRNVSLHPRWIDATHFWYTRDTADGTQWVLVDAERTRARPAFDHAALAKALARSSNKPVDAADLPLQAVAIDPDTLDLRFSAFDKHWLFSAKGKLSEREGLDRKLLVSPNGRLAVFSRDHNLWLKNLDDDSERALTQDGEKFYVYGALADAKGFPAQRPEAVWSPDSRKLLVVQTDDRKVAELPMIEFAPKDAIRPRAFSRRTALPGDANITGYRLVSIDVETGRQVEPRYPHLAQIRMKDTPIGAGRVWWNTEGALAYFVDVDRGEKAARVVEFDTQTGATRVLFEESADTYIELGQMVYMPAALVPLHDSKELIWYSERSGWAHLYLYDIATGQLKRALTQGEWMVRDVIGVDAPRRQLYLTVAGRQPDKDPYYRDLVRVNLDTGQMETLSTSALDHQVRTAQDLELSILAYQGEDVRLIGGLSPDRRFIIQQVASLGELTRTELLDRDGKSLMLIEQASAHGLPQGWRAPTRTRTTAADGKTAIYGALFHPSHFDPKQRYPVIDYVYGGPQVAYTPKMIGPGAWSMAQALAELGFVVSIIDGRGTAERDHAFHTASYGHIDTASNLEDHIAALRELARTRPYLDLDRVGIYGFSGGGYMTANALLRYPDFYKVGVAGGGNYDQRLFWQTWGERYQGLVDGDNYEAQATSKYVDGLRGHLMFIHGLMDHGVHPGGLFQLTQALMDANKRFDLVLFPRAAHELPGYGVGRMWDYFVEHLAGKTPPDYRVRTASEREADKAKAREKADTAKSGKPN